MPKASQDILIELTGKGKRSRSYEYNFKNHKSLLKDVEKIHSYNVCEVINTIDKVADET